jgi:hypothetical protein
MTSWQERAAAAAKALVVAAGSAYNVATGDVERAAYNIARDYGTTSARQIEEEIRRHIRK